MEILKIIIATIAGTSVMTAFSYLASESFNKLWKEPVLINLVLSRAAINVSPSRKSALGWIIHYVIGLAFVISYHLLWKYYEIDPTWFCGLILGIGSGFIGVISWYFLFMLPTEKPKIKFKQYYLQLFKAHILFALTVVAVYRLCIMLN